MFFKNEIYIPIGTNCSIASYLRHIGYRKEAFPFDWTVTPIQSAIELINNGFEDFFKKENLVFLEPTNRLLFKENGIDVQVSEEIITPVYDKRYNILFVHDFSENAQEEYELVKEKYMKRIKRIKDVLEDKTIKISFVYDNTEPNKWQKEQYKKVQYQLNKLTLKELEKINNNIQILSFEDLKQSTRMIKLYKSSLKKIGIIK